MIFTKGEIINHFNNKEGILHPSQGKICLPILKRIHKKMSLGLNFSPIQVDQDLIIDGHHRYLASLLSQSVLEEVPSKKTHATIQQRWEDLEYVEEEWDTQDKIQMLNELDAMNNNITLEKLVVILNQNQ